VEDLELGVGVLGLMFTMVMWWRVEPNSSFDIPPR
jgi:hypothetical protein